jgi:hypothetical protein
MHILVFSTEVIVFVATRLGNMGSCQIANVVIWPVLEMQHSSVEVLGETQFTVLVCSGPQ